MRADDDQVGVESGRGGEDLLNRFADCGHRAHIRSSAACQRGRHEPAELRERGPLESALVVGADSRVDQTRIGDEERRQPASGLSPERGCVAQRRRGLIRKVNRTQDRSKQTPRT